jgi:hypothetical protein
VLSDDLATHLKVHEREFEKSKDRANEFLRDAFS